MNLPDCQIHTVHHKGPEESVLRIESTYTLGVDGGLICIRDIARHRPSGSFACSCLKLELKFTIRRKLHCARSKNFGYTMLIKNCCQQSNGNQMSKRQSR